MTSDVLNALSSIFKALWDGLGTLIVPGTENLTFRTVLVAPFGAIVFITVLMKVLDISAAAPSHVRDAFLARNNKKESE